MVKYFNMNNYFNKFFQKITLKKQFLNKLRIKSFNVDRKIKKFKIKNNFFFRKFRKHDNLITFIINITFSKSNIFLNIMNSQGVIKFSCSSGSLFYKGRSKQAKVLVIKSMLKILITKLWFLYSQPIALHLKNVKFMKRWIIARFKKMFFIQIVKSFNLYSFNGCRLIKLKHKKKEMAELA